MVETTSTKSAVLAAIVKEINALEDNLSKDMTIGELTHALRSIRSTNKAGLPQKYSMQSEKQQVAALKKSLQAAVTLEYATIPPYLCALWSIKDELHPVAVSIREVVQEEMLHMALACNMLTSLGGTPQISSAVVNYPSALPGGVHKGLIVKLSGLTKSTLSDFLWIERPIEEVPIEHPYSKGEASDLEQVLSGHMKSSDATIGEFYDEIHQAFKAYVDNPLNPPLSPDNQVTGPLAYAVIRNLENVSFAIDLIKDQGEGSENNPEKTDGEFSHYYRFLEVMLERKYEWNSEKGLLEIIGDFPFPDVWPMAEVPVGGYQRKDVSEEVWFHLDEFDNIYSKLLDQLQGAWSFGGQASLIHAYETMFDLQASAKWLMQTKTPFGAGATFGPCFRYKQPDDRLKGNAL